MEGDGPIANSGRLPGGRGQGDATCFKKNAEPLYAPLLMPPEFLLVPGLARVISFFSLIIGLRNLVNSKNHKRKRIHTLLGSEGRWLEPVLRGRTSRSNHALGTLHHFSELPFCSLKKKKKNEGPGPSSFNFLLSSDVLAFHISEFLLKSL